MQKRKYKKLIYLLAGCLSVAGVAQAYVASSSNYRLQADSVNFGGGLGTSANMKLESTGGEVSTGDSTSTDFNLAAGYQAMQSDSYISVSAPTDIVLLPSVDGLLGGQADGSADWNVVTNNLTGYALMTKSSRSPAMTSANSSIDDYVPGYADPDLHWSVGESDKRFGFSPKGQDVTARFLDNGISCNSGSLSSTDTCWDGFSTTDKIISSSDLPNESSSGATTTVKFRAEIGSKATVKAGSYQADIIVTAITL